MIQILVRQNAYISYLFPLCCFKSHPVLSAFPAGTQCVGTTSASQSLSGLLVTHRFNCWFVLMATTLLSLHEGTWLFFSQKCDPFPQFHSRCKRGGSFSYLSSSLAFLHVWILPTRHCCSTNLCEKNLSVGVVNTLSLLLLLYFSVKLDVSKNLAL